MGEKSYMCFFKQLYKPRPCILHIISKAIPNYPRCFNSWLVGWLCSTLVFLLITWPPGIDKLLALIYFILSLSLYFIFLNSQIQKETVVFDLDKEDHAPGHPLNQENNESVSQSTSVSASTKVKSSNRGSLVQATISTLFQKVNEKVSF